MTKLKHPITEFAKGMKEGWQEPEQDSGLQPWAKRALWVILGAAAGLAMLAVASPLLERFKG